MTAGASPLGGGRGRHEVVLKTVSETAGELRCSTSLIYRLISEGKLQAVRIGKAKILVPQDRIEAFLTAQLAEGGDAI